MAGPIRVIILLICFIIESYLIYLRGLNKELEPDKQIKWLGLNNTQQRFAIIFIMVFSFIFWYLSSSSAFWHLGLGYQ
jgi:hypothetical protein